MATDRFGCPLCDQAPPGTSFQKSRCLDPIVIEQLARQNPGWRNQEGGCPTCVQQALLETRLRLGRSAMHQCIQHIWPLDAEAAFGALPTPLRLHADPRFTGKGVTVAHIDAGFYPHADLIQPRNRIRAWVETWRRPVRWLRFDEHARPAWPGSEGHTHWQNHGLMTTTAAFGNGWLSYGLYRGIASGANLVLVQTWDRDGRITNATLARALRWIRRHRREFDIRIVNFSVAGDPVTPLKGNAVDTAVKDLVDEGVIVIAAAGNRCAQQLVPPASALEAITVGGLDDRNVFDRDLHEVWHSNYDRTEQGHWKPEMVAPSLWVVAPLLPGSPSGLEAQQLFARRDRGDETANSRIAEMKLVNRYYQHVEGTSFASPIVASIVACMLEAKPDLSPQAVRRILMEAAYPVPGASAERQGAGAVDAGRAIELTLAEAI